MDDFTQGGEPSRAREGTSVDPVILLQKAIIEISKEALAKSHELKASHDHDKRIEGVFQAGVSFGALEVPHVFAEKLFAAFRKARANDQD